MRKAVIVIPTYNESHNIEHIIREIFSQQQKIEQWELHILVVDSESPDGTSLKVKEQMNTFPHLHLLSTPKEGLGKAYINGFRMAIEKLSPYVIFEMDADLSHDPAVLPHFLATIERGADVVIGSRYIPGGSIPKDWGLHRKVFSVLGNLIIKFGFMRFKNSDWTSGYRAIKTWVIKKALSELNSYSGYVFQVALLDQAYLFGATIKEVPIQFIDRKEGVSKINSIQYILQTLLYVFTHSPFIKFVLTGLFGFAVDFSFAFIFINGIQMSKPLANMASAEIAIIVNFFINNYWSFKHKQIQGGLLSRIKGLLLFNLVSSGSIIIQGAGLFILIRLLGDWSLAVGSITLSSWILYKIGIIALIIIPYSYVLYNKIIWKKK